MRRVALLLKLLDAIFDTPKLWVLAVSVLVIGAISYVYAQHYLACQVVKVENLEEYVEYYDSEVLGRYQTEEISLTEIRKTPEGFDVTAFGKRPHGAKVAWEWLLGDEGINVSWLTIEAIRFSKVYSSDADYYLCTVFYSTPGRAKDIAALREGYPRQGIRGVTPDRTYYGYFEAHITEAELEMPIHFDILQDKSWRWRVNTSGGHIRVRSNYKYLGRLWIDSSNLIKK